jgi:hypothetical protein
VNEKHLFKLVKQQPSSALLDLLAYAYREMSVQQRHAVFGARVRDAPPSSVNGPALLKRIKRFYGESVAGKYYAPFALNSQNFTHMLMVRSF